jgi:hypothetical protein
VSAGKETTDVDAVMDGDLDAFMTAYLRHTSKQASEERLSTMAS